MKKTMILGLSLVSALAFGQSKKQQDIEAIKSMCGCYEVTFNFAETFSPDEEYEFHKRYRSGGLEWVELIEDEKDKISMQHLLIVGENQIVKHWRQDWLYQNTSLYSYSGDQVWDYLQLNKKEVKGQWTQKVYQVDDGPRYEGSATWVHTDGKHYWEAESYSPLPRREFSKRSDYNLMLRKNRHEITSEGWVHEQDNDKIIRKAEADELLAEEKGYNTYVKVDVSRCKTAQKWWAKNEAYWAEVRAAWNEIYAQHNTLNIKTKVADKILYQKIFNLGDEVIAQSEFDGSSVRQQVKEIILSHKGEQ
ncbi:MAG: hypothetical protein HWE23_11145 [Rhodobacteraceae bacterium]|nr:hypothetical protein [Paracoccaceae bacterium]